MDLGGMGGPNILTPRLALFSPDTELERKLPLARPRSSHTEPMEGLKSLN